MRLRAALLAVVLAVPGRVLAQGVPPPAAQPSAEAQAAADLARLRRALQSPTPLSDAALGPAPTFRVSVSEKIDIWKYWGDPSEVSAMVRPNGGTWHQEFQDMVTPDEFKGYGGILSNGEKLQLAASSLAFAGALQLVGAGIRQAKGALENRSRRQAKDEVQRELEEFYRLNPEARPPATPIP